jgi:hypothetical protein
MFRDVHGASSLGAVEQCARMIRTVENELLPDYQGHVTWLRSEVDKHCASVEELKEVWEAARAQFAQLVQTPPMAEDDQQLFAALLGRNAEVRSIIEDAETLDSHMDDFKQQIFGEQRTRLVAQVHSVGCQLHFLAVVLGRVNLNFDDIGEVVVICQKFLRLNIQNLAALDLLEVALPKSEDLKSATRVLIAQLDKVYAQRQRLRDVLKKRGGDNVNESGVNLLALLGQITFRARMVEVELERDVPGALNTHVLALGKHLKDFFVYTTNEAWPDEDGALTAFEARCTATLLQLAEVQASPTAEEQTRMIGMVRGLRENIAALSQLFVEEGGYVHGIFRQPKAAA